MKRTLAAVPALPRARLAAALLVAAGIAVYANGLNAPFIMDDHTAIISNAQIRRLMPITVPLSPPPETPVARRPLVNLTLAVNYAMGGLDVRPYHATNLVIHLAAALMLLGVVRRALQLPGMPPALAERASAVAFAAALLWLLHPLQTEVVNYVSQRTTSLKGLMYLLTLYCSVRALRPRAGRWTIAAVVACAAGMACKESMVTAPLMVAIFDRVFVYRSMRDALQRRRALYAGLAGTWVILAMLMLQGGRTTVGFDAGVSPWTYLLNQTTIVVDYLRFALLPYGLIADYGLPLQLTLRDVLGPALLLMALAGATLLALMRWPRAGFLGVWFFVTLAPTSSVIPIATEVGAERRMHLPLAALVLLCVCGATLVLARTRTPKAAAVALCALVATALGAGTIVRNEEYDSRLALSATVVERRPHGRAYARYAGLLIDAGRRPEAIVYLQKAKEENFVGSRFLLGNEYLADGRLDDGIAELRGFLERHPHHASAADARLMLAHAYAAKGWTALAAAEYEKVLAIAPRQLRAHDALASILLAEQRIADALPHLEQIAAARPHDVDALGKFGTALAASGRLDDALVMLTRAVQADPTHERARQMLARVQALRETPQHRADVSDR